MSETLASAIEQAALALPADDLLALANAIEHYRTADLGARHVLPALVPTERFAALVDPIVAAWSVDVSGGAIALALRAACGAVMTARRESDVEIAWTGPTTSAVPVRATKPVLLEVIGAARSHLTLLSFAANKVPDVVDALHAAAGRGVDVRLVLETADAGHLSVDAAEAFATLSGAVTIWTWPLDKRPSAFVGSLPSVHAKAAVADHAVAFVSSANLTDSALNRNMELGLVVRGGPVPRRLADHLRELMDTQVLCCVQLRPPPSVRRDVG